jgi:hypothetical protein
VDRLDCLLRFYSINSDNRWHFFSLGRHPNPKWFRLKQPSIVHKKRTRWWRVLATKLVYYSIALSDKLRLHGLRIRCY